MLESLWQAVSMTCSRRPCFSVLVDRKRQAYHFHRQRRVPLVDLVISTGKTTVELMQGIRKLDSGIYIVIVASVIQAQCTARNSVLYTIFGDSNASHVVLRRSETNTTYSA